MSKAEWCMNETSRSMCGISRKVCNELGFVIQENSGCIDCGSRAVSKLLSKRAAGKCLHMSKAEWCKSESSRATCGVSVKVCTELGFEIKETSECANCDLKAVSRLLNGRKK